MVAVFVICISPGGAWVLARRGSKHRGLPGCRMRAVQRSAKILLMRAACTARASSSVWMAGDACSAADARIWWIAKTGHK